MVNVGTVAERCVLCNDLFLCLVIVYLVESASWNVEGTKELNLSLGLFLRKPNYILVIDWRQPFSHVKQRQPGLKNLIWTFYLIFEEKAPRPGRTMYVVHCLLPS